MPLVLDTFNILMTEGVLPPDLAGIDIPGLAALIARSRYAQQRILCVCDGAPGADLPPAGPLAPPATREHDYANWPDVVVRYSGRGVIADDLIAAIIKTYTAPRRLIVVSSDHEVQRHARRRRCPVLTSQEFLQHLAADARLPASAPARVIPSVMSDAQIEQWVKTFGVDEASLEREAEEALRLLERDDAPADDRESPDVRNEETADHSSDQVEAGVASDTLAPPEPMLPDDLVAQAEQLWNSNRPAGTDGQQFTDPIHQTPAEASDDLADAGTAGNIPVDSTNVQAAAASTQQPIAPAADDSGDDSSSEINIDMNALFPNDGKTLPLRKRANRKHRRT